MIRSAAPSLDGVPGRVLAFAGGVGVILALRVFDRGEAFNDRTKTLVTLAVIGAALAGAVLFTLAGLVARRWRPFSRLAVGGVLGAGGFAAAFYLAFGIYAKFIGGPDESDIGIDEWGPAELHIVGQMIDAVKLYVVMAPRYLLPWPLPAVALLGGWLCAKPMRSPGASGAAAAPRPEARRAAA